MQKITIIGAGYVGFSLAVLFGQEKAVTIFDIDLSKLEKIDKQASPIPDTKINEFLRTKILNIKTCDNLVDSIEGSDLIVIALPTNFDETKGSFDTHAIESTIADIFQRNQSTPVLIKSTVPIGFTRKMQCMYPLSDIIFSPEFLREGSALDDNLNPHRIIIGSMGAIGKAIAKLFLLVTQNQPPILFMSSDEAESTKLFANAYLATRVSFFNELDTFALENKLDTKSIIDGIISDPRIGSGYSNPSFGYGGYCLPKDTKQLQSHFGSAPQEIFTATIASNHARKNYIAKYIASLSPKVIGIYGLMMKKDSSNYRESSILDVIKMIKSLKKEINIIIFEPAITKSTFLDCEVVTSKDSFIKQSNLIVTNRIDDSLTPVLGKVFSRDIYGES
jgi:UDPglucose 6-dehydrogenase